MHDNPNDGSPSAASAPEARECTNGSLVFGGDPRIADQTACGGDFLPFSYRNSRGLR
jgi:hypothetical protein